MVTSAALSVVHVTCSADHFGTVQLLDRCRHFSPDLTGEDNREGLVDALAGYLMTLRLSERSQSADPPFLGAGAGLGGGFGSSKTFSLSARARDGEVPKATAALMEELERARAHGFVDAELGRVKQLILASTE